MKSEIIDIDEIQDIIIAYARGDFSKRMNISEKRDARDAIVVGVNMLGDELEQTMISRDYFGSIYNAVSDIMVVSDQNWKITDVNNAAEDKLGLNKSEIDDKDVRELFVGSKLNLEKAIVKSEKSNIRHYNFETICIDSKGVEFPVSCSISKIIDRFDVQQGYLIIAKDITEKRNREQHLLKVVVSTQENERKRLAYDLHDSLGQELNAIKMYLSTLDYMDKSDSSYSKTFAQCKSMLDQSINTIRSLSFDLMPKSIENGDLSYALQQLADKLSGVCRIECRFKYDSLGLDKETQILIYRVFQEFLNNSMRHANASKITLSIEKKKTQIVFILKDNGVGFDETNTNAGNGIHNMKSRLEAINASYEYKGELKKGTTLKFILKP